MNDMVLWFIIAFIVVIVTLGVLACIWKYVKNIFFDILFSIIIIGIAIVIYYPIKNAIYNNGFTSTDVVFQSDILTEEDTQYFISPAKSSSQVAYLDEENKVQYIESENLKIFYDSDKPFVRKVKYWNHWYYWYELELHLRWRD
jgi:hypothetical protein